MVAGHERNMKVTEPIDVYIADKLVPAHLRRQSGIAQRRGVPSQLTGKTLVVFGGSYGIGADIAELARAYGATVRRYSRSTTNTHVERRSEVAAAAEQVLAETGRIDFVVNTAGVLMRGSWRDLGGIGLLLDRRQLPRADLRRAGVLRAPGRETRGSLLLFTSSSYTRGRSGYSLYSSAKAAVVNLTQALADEWADAGVRVNCVNPERTGTPYADQGLRRRSRPARCCPRRRSPRQSLDVLLSGQTGHIIDIRREDGPAAIANG